MEAVATLIFGVVSLTLVFTSRNVWTGILMGAAALVGAIAEHVKAGRDGQHLNGFAFLGAVLGLVAIVLGSIFHFT